MFFVARSGGGGGSGNGNGSGSGSGNGNGRVLVAVIAAVRNGLGHFYSFFVDLFCLPHRPSQIGKIKHKNTGPRITPKKYHIP